MKFTSPHSAFLYVQDMWLYHPDRQNRKEEDIKDAEKVIMQDACFAGQYATLFLEDRWKEAEDTIRKDDFCWGEYVTFLISVRTKEKIWQWLREGVDSNLIDILNHYIFWDKNFEVEVYDYVLQQRPDLIEEIWTLPPPLQEKYQHELNLARTDI